MTMIHLIGSSELKKYRYSFTVTLLQGVLHLAGQDVLDLLRLVGRKWEARSSCTMYIPSIGDCVSIDVSQLISLPNAGDILLVRVKLALQTSVQSEYWMNGVPGPDEFRSPQLWNPLKSWGIFRIDNPSRPETHRIPDTDILPTGTEVP